MECPRCGAANPEAANFCQGCGARMTLTCPQCGTDLPVEARFCTACGAPAGAAPSQLAPALAAEPAATEIIADSLRRLVPREYAERLLATRGQVSAERRMVTILFSDIKGSTAMAEHLDPEDVMEIMNGAFEVLITAIHKHEGTLGRLMGDAILAFFGAPVAHEDDPERAVRAALDILAGARGYADRLAREWSIPGFNVRVGIHTGLVVVGEVGSDLRVEYTAMGDAVNLAARMEQAAEPGTILITADTHRLVRGLFQCDAVGPLMVKGKSEPVPAFRVIAARPRAFRAPTRGVEGVETRMVGRDAEMKRLQDLFLATAQARERRLVTVVADAGLGKSRLLFEFERWLERQAVPVWLMRARAGQDLQGVPYGLFRSLFALHLGISDGDPAADVRRRFEEGFASLLGQGEESCMKANFVAHLLGYDLPDSPYAHEMSGDPQQVRNRAVFYLAEFFASTSNAATLVLLLEDIHWADDSSLDLLGRLAQDLPDRPWLAVAAARPVLFRRRPQWGQGLPCHSRMDLGLLSQHASQELVDQILHRLDQAPDALRAVIVGGAEGNPFFLEELVRMFVDDGVIIVAEDRWRVEPGRLAAAHVPASLTGILQARLDRLPLAERGTLQQASVVGRLFWDLAVAYVGERTAAGGAGKNVPTTLGELRRREMIFRHAASSFQGSQEYIFKHALLRQVAYEGIVRRLRQRYHSLTADWLLAQVGDRAGEHTGLIAEHLELAGRNAEAAVYLQAAAEGAAARYANEEAIRYYRRVLALREALPADSPGESIAVLYERLGDLYLWLTRHDEAREAYERAGARPEAQDRLVQARLLRKTANTLRDHYSYEEALRTYVEAENTLGKAPKAAGPGVGGVSAAARQWWSEWMETRLDKVQLYYWQNRADEGFDLLAALQPAVEQYGTADQRAHFFLSFAANALRRDRMAPSEMTREIIRLARVAAEESLRAKESPSTLFRLGFYSLFAGELPVAEEYITTTLRKSERTGDISLQARCLTYLAIVCRAQGRVEDVESYASRGLEVAKAAGMPEYLGTARANQAWVAWCRGDLDAAEAHGRAALALWAQLPEGHASATMQWTALWPLLCVALQWGETATAIDCAQAMLQPSQMRLPGEAEDLLERAIQADERDDPTQARELLDQAIACAGRVGQL